MKLSKLLFAVFCGAFAYGANAADITIFYSPTCPHCHHARDFIENTLIYEYNDLKVTTVNVMEADNYKEFTDALKNCKYESGGVPVLVIGEKCFQGYADSMQGELREAVEVGLSDEQKSSASANKAEMEKDKAAFIESHADRKNAVTEREIKKKIVKKGIDPTDALLYTILGFLLLGMGFVLFKKHK